MPKFVAFLEGPPWTRSPSAPSVSLAQNKELNCDMRADYGDQSKVVRFELEMFVSNDGPFKGEQVVMLTITTPTPKDAPPGTHVRSTQVIFGMPIKDLVEHEGGPRVAIFQDLARYIV